MLRSEDTKIPPEVEEAAGIAAHERWRLDCADADNSPVTDWREWAELEPDEQAGWRRQARAAIAAALAAWEGAELERIGKGYEWPLTEEYTDRIILPLPQEARDE